MNTHPHIDISGSLDNFKKHFLIEGNTKIVFSAKYGTGKSYFLKNFFEDTKIENSYYPIILSPVNYVVSSNEDIFDLIKVDIIKHLHLDNKLDLNKIAPTISTYTSLKKYAKKKPLEIVKNVSSCLTKISGVAEVINKTSESVIKLLDDFEKFETELKEGSKIQEQKLLDFANSIIESKNSYLEYNFITQLIISQLEILSTKGKSKRKNVLIIEDFDRLDPAHIFRILNIFSAHQSDEDGTNKFGFDKIILVCDLDNIEHIYRHFYGSKTDFEGYIDKFYSFEPYYFDNREALKYHLKNVMHIQLPEYAFNCLIEIIAFFIEGKKLSLRKVLQTKLLPEEINEDFLLFTISETDHAKLNGFNARFIGQREILFNKKNLDILIILRVLKCLFGNYDKLNQTLTEAKQERIAFNPQKIVDVYKTLVFPNFFVDRSSHYKTLLFRDWTNNNFDYPIVALNGHPFLIRYKWTNHTSYQRDQSFFDEFTIDRLNDDRIPDISHDYLFNQLC